MNNATAGKMEFSYNDNDSPSRSLDKIKKIPVGG